MEIDKDRLVSGCDEDRPKDSIDNEEKMMPQDVDAFFKHPLVAANQQDNGDALALLHEYQTLYAGQSGRSDGSPGQVLDGNFNLKMSKVPTSDPLLDIRPSPKNTGSSVNDPTLPSINVLSRSTFAQNLQTPPASLRSQNSQTNFSQTSKQMVDWRNTVNLKSGQFKTNDSRFSYEKLDDSSVLRSEASNLKLSKLPPLSLLTKDVPIPRSSLPSEMSQSNHDVLHNNVNSQSDLLKQSVRVAESSAIDMSFQGGVKKSSHPNGKFLTNKQFFGDSDLIQMLEKQIPPDQFINPANVTNVTSGQDFQKLHPAIPSLPFPLPEVPLGYRLVITHLPITSDQEPDSKHITQLIIDNPFVPQTSANSFRSPLNQPPSEFNQKSQQNTLQNTFKARENATDVSPTATHFEISCPAQTTKKFLTEESRMSASSVDSSSKENLLKKCLEEADLLPLLSHEEPETQTRKVTQPSEISLMQKDVNFSSWQAMNAPPSNNLHQEMLCSPSLKRITFKGKPNSRWNHISYIKKIEPDTSGFKFHLEAATSTNPRKDEDRVTYLNKSQYYGLVLQHSPTATDYFSASQTLRSVVMLVFRERLPVAEELRAWECWYSRQHSYKQRVLDIDSKNTGACDVYTKPNFIEEIAHNAASITWSRHTSVKLNLALNCLSTDFSHQKGIRGNPLHIQIDTYDGDDAAPCHRAYCQIKVFCDKGADRKIREEEKKRSKTSEDCIHQESCDRSYFYSMADLTTPPVLFSPSQNFNHHFQGMDAKISSFKRQNPDKLGGPPESKRGAPDKLLIFVREEKDAVFNALVVQPPAVESLCRAIQEKFLSPSVRVENIYKESKFMKVKVDDVIVSCIPDESTFTIKFSYDFQRSVEAVPLCDVTLSEIRVRAE